MPHTTFVASLGNLLSFFFFLTYTGHSSVYHISAFSLIYPAQNVQIIRSNSQGVGYCAILARKLALRHCFTIVQAGWLHGSTRGSFLKLFFCGSWLGLWVICRVGLYARKCSHSQPYCIAIAVQPQQSQRPCLKCHRSKPHQRTESPLHQVCWKFKVTSFC